VKYWRYRDTGAPALPTVVEVEILDEIKRRDWGFGSSET